MARGACRGVGRWYLPTLRRGRLQRGAGGLTPGGTDPSGDGGSYPPRGAAPRGGMPAGGLHFSCEKWRKEHQRGEFLPSGLPTLVWDILRGIPLFSCLACGPASTVGRGPPPSWAGWEAWVGGRRDRARKIQTKNSPKRKSPNQGPYMGLEKDLRPPCCVSIPKEGASEQRAALIPGCRAEPCDSFPLLSYKESRAPAGQAGPPGRCAPRWVRAPTACRARTNGGEAPGPTWQGCPCAPSQRYSVPISPPP